MRVLRSAPRVTSLQPMMINKYSIINQKQKKFKKRPQVNEVEKNSLTGVLITGSIKVGAGGAMSLYHSSTRGSASFETNKENK